MGAQEKAIASNGSTTAQKRMMPVPNILVIPIVLFLSQMSRTQYLSF
jgi:hypothetical protein